MSRGRWLALGVASAFMLAVAGCGESTDVTVYKQGEYKGKTDARPWANQHFQDKAAWEKQLGRRTQAQNEYVRIGN